MPQADDAQSARRPRRMHLGMTPEIAVWPPSVFTLPVHVLRVDIDQPELDPNDSYGTDPDGDLVAEGNRTQSTRFEKDDNYWEGEGRDSAIGGDYTEPGLYTRQTRTAEVIVPIARKVGDNYVFLASAEPANNHSHFMNPNATLDPQYNPLPPNRPLADDNSAEYIVIDPIDLDVDSDNTSSTSDFGPDRTEAEDSVELVDPGRLVFVNNDDDDKDGLVDYLDMSNADEDDFVKIVLALDPKTIVNPDIHVRFEFMDTRIKLWTEQGINNRIDRDLGDETLPGHLVRSYDETTGVGEYTLADLGFSNADREQEFWIEGLLPSPNYHGFGIYVSLDPDGDGVFEYQDVVRVNTLKLDLVGAEGLFKEDGTYETGFGAGGGVEQDGRIYINHEFDTSTSMPVWKKDTQYADFTVKVVPDIGTHWVPPPWLGVVWRAEDVDDPSDQSPAVYSPWKSTLDDNDYFDSDEDGQLDEIPTGEDNDGETDGKPVFEDLTGYGEVNGVRPINGGESRVRFNGTDIGGDNFVLYAELGTAASNAGEANSVRVSMWKRINIEYDAMTSAGSINALNNPSVLNEIFKMTFVEFHPDDNPTTVDDYVYPVGSGILQMGDDVPSALSNSRLYVTSGSGEFDNEDEKGWFYAAVANYFVDDSAVQITSYYEGGAEVTDHSKVHLTSQVNNSIPAGSTLYIMNGSEWIGFGVVDWHDLLEVVTLAPNTYVEPAPDPETFQPIMHQFDLYGHGFDDYDQLTVKIKSTKDTSYIGMAPGPGGRGGYNGRVMVYMPIIISESLNPDVTLVHELGHALGFEHVCGHYDYKSGGTHSGACAMHYTSLWMLDPDEETPTILPWTKGDPSTDFCAEHIMCIRRQKLEEYELIGW